MPIIIPKDLPAAAILENENVFVMNGFRAVHQDIRPIRIAILNLMPKKIETETQLLRLIGNIPLQVEVTLLQTVSYKPKNVSEEHLTNFYTTFKEIKNQKFDGMIITGAPVEHLEFEEVEYWEELKEIMDFTLTNVFSTLHICWGAQAALYHHYNIPKYGLSEKMFGVFPHCCLNKKSKLLRGFDDIFYVPHSRHTEVKKEDIEKHGDKLEILTVSDVSDIHIIASKDGRQIFVTGHSEYDKDTLKAEYERDVARGLDIKLPVNYFEDNDLLMQPIITWRGHANLLFSNWLNYYVYQETPYTYIYE